MREMGSVLPWGQMGRVGWRGREASFSGRVAVLEAGELCLALSWVQAMLLGDSPWVPRGCVSAVDLEEERGG